MNVLMTAMQPGGGIKTFFRYIYSQSVFQNFSFTLIAPDERQELAKFLDSSLGSNRVRVLSSPSNPVGFLSKVRATLSEDDFDLLHSHGFGAGLLSEVACFGLRTPKHLMTAHDVFLTGQFSGWNGGIRKVCMAMLFKRMNGIHTVTVDATDNFKSFFPSIPESRLYPILHGVDTEFFLAGSPVDLRGELGISAHTPLIGFFGRFMGQKGFRTLVDAMQLLRVEGFEPMPVVLTFGWGGFIREDYDYLSGLGLKDHFIQMPATDNMPSMIKSVDMVAMPSRWEACGLLGMEVLSAGVPLLSTNCIGLREVVEGSPTKLFAPGDSGALAELIMREIRSSTKSCFHQYQSSAVNRFHISRPAKALRDLYLNMADSNS